jgi:hypothetical protein
MLTIPKIGQRWHCYGNRNLVSEVSRIIRISDHLDQIELKVIQTGNSYYPKGGIFRVYDVNINIDFRYLAGQDKV